MAQTTASFFERVRGTPGTHELTFQREVEKVEEKSEQEQYEDNCRVFFGVHGRWPTYWDIAPPAPPAPPAAPATSCHSYHHSCCH
ncbi:hypothetical protein H4R19_003845 [Coemansia spiralis]|nr:hypothetical protein H4R19_003845 [Coemansia spiralis]